MELQLVGAVALGAAGATGVLLTLARRGAAPWLHSKRQKGDGPTNGSLLSSDESKDSNRCTHRPRRVWSAVSIIRHVTCIKVACVIQMQGMSYVYNRPIYSTPARSWNCFTVLIICTILKN